MVEVRFGTKPRYDIKNGAALKLQDYGRRRQISWLKIEIELNDHYQNVDLGLKSLLEASKPQNIDSRTKKYRTKLENNENITLL